MRIYQGIAFCILTVLFLSCSPEYTEITVWTQERRSDGSYQFVDSLMQAYIQDNPTVIINLVAKETETLRADFLRATKETAPQLLWTVNDHAGVFVANELLQPVDRLINLEDYVEAIQIHGQTWAVPISTGNHLVLFYNRDKISNPPQDTDELFRIGAGLSEGNNYAIVWNQEEPFWLVPWLGGFNGRVFAHDGVTPTLNTPEMVSTLNLLYEIKISGITPEQADYVTADSLFKEGRAAMIINGDWSLEDYYQTLGDTLGIARLPAVSATGRKPAPYTAGKHFMIPHGVSGNTLNIVITIIQYATNYQNQVAMVEELSRLPSRVAVLADPVVTNDILLSGSSQQVVVGTPMPSVIEMQCNWDAMRQEMQQLFNGTKTAEQAALDMQAYTEQCISQL